MVHKRFSTWVVAAGLLAAAGMLALVGLALPVAAQDTPDPTIVAIPGTIQSVLGCSGDWQTDCELTYLTYDEADDVWSATWELPAGDYEYKVALNGSWNENYGLGAEPGGQNIPLSLAEDTAVTFIYDHNTHWVTDSVNSITATVAGSFQDEIGCPGDWNTDCLRTWMQDPDGDGVYEFRTIYIPAGDYEAKVAIDQTWDVNYGADGVAGGDNIPFSVPADWHEVVVSYDTADNMITIAISEEPAPEPEPEPEPAAAGMPVMAQPERVTVVGSLQAALGCGGDWDVACDVTDLAFDQEDALWSASFRLPAGDYEYKAAIDGAWDENYGFGAEADGPNITLMLAEETKVTFFYDHVTHWITDDVNSVVATAVGDFQEEMGCTRDWMPDCLRSWMQDVDGDNVYTFTSAYLPAGDWKLKVTLDQGIKENYGADGALNGTAIDFSIPADGHEVVVTYDAASHAIAISVSDEPVLSPEDLAAAQEAAASSAAPDLQAMVPEVEATEPPTSVTIAGTVQSALGCSGDWQPGCEESMLTYDAGDDMWIATWDLPAGRYEYKAALNGDWEPENYGLGAEEHGANIPLVLEEDTTVTFFYDHKTHWVSDSANSIIAVAPGSFQGELGCTPEANDGDWEPACFRSLLQDPDGDGIYIFYTNALPPGSYEAKVALNGNWTVNYGLDGVPSGPNIPFTIPAEMHQVVVAYNTADNMVMVDVSEEPVDRPIFVAPTVVGSLARAEAHWLARDLIAWDVPVEEGASYLLHYSPTAGLALDEAGVSGGETVALSYLDAGLPFNLKQQYPHLATLPVFRLDESDVMLAPDILRGQTAVSATNAAGELLDATGLQIPGVLDDLFAYDGALGVIYADGVPALKVWAPTAQTVRLHLFADSDPATASTVIDMTRDDASGVWSITGEADWNYQFYLYEVTVYAPTTQQIEVNLVTDPYSLSLATNSARSQIVDLLNDPALKPEGWDALVKPALDAPEDIVLYELHVRDFSVNDATVPDEYRGTFMAFTVQDSDGMTHLKNLASAGLTHIHLLPVFDIATINENKAEWVLPDWEELAGYAADSDQQQAIIEPIRDQDAFNWGYDPFHYTVPEGSYSTDPDGVARIVEFRQMVMGLSDADLRVVMDVVYNHTNSAGQNPNSVLDKVVPGYYHRLNGVGGVETSTCCANTATEHVMMEKLMIDSVLMWTTAYKVDGFRFDLMGHHMVDNMAHLRAALDGLTLEADGVDGPKVYVYGEGWNFGEVLDGARGENATQLNVGGLGIGTFNDRVRDSVRGGSPFGDWQFQGFANGLYYDPNGITAGDEAAQKERLLLFADRVRVALAGNLRDYAFVDGTGATVTGADVDYNGSPTGYTLDPQEHISYISAHDNETLFDKNTYAIPADATMDERVRIQNMGISIVTLSQGVPFYHAGVDMLRSKSFDGNSYNSGDWFNKLDFTYDSNNFGVGLPPRGDNQAKWPLAQPLLANPDLAPGHDDIVKTVMHTQEMLQIRKSSKLFRLETADQIMERVLFHNTGPDQIPGLIVMSISDITADDLDPEHELIVVLFNATDEDVSFTQGELGGLGLVLHPVQQASYDPVVQMASFDSLSGTFSVPARTTAVFVLPEGPDPALVAELQATYDALSTSYGALQAAWNAAEAGEALTCGEYPDVVLPRSISAQGAADLAPLADALQTAAVEAQQALRLWKIECMSPRASVQPGVVRQALASLEVAGASLDAANTLLAGLD